MAASDPLLHLVGARAWELVDDAYVPAGFAQEGFVHLSAPHQLAGVAEARFAGREDLLVLVIDPSALDAEVVWEDLEGEGQRYPHLYAPVPRAAVTAVHAYRPGPDGRFPPPWEVVPEVPDPSSAGPRPGEVVVRDVSRAGHELGRTTLRDLPARLTLRELLQRRIRADLAVYNAAPGPVLVALVQPADAVRYSDGYRLREPRVLDVDASVAAAEQAVTAGLLTARVGDQVATALDDELDLAGHDEVVLVLQRPVVAG